MFNLNWHEMLLLLNPKITKIIAFLLTERVRSGIFVCAIPPPTRLTSTPEGEKLDSPAPSLHSLHEFRRLKNDEKCFKNWKLRLLKKKLCVSFFSPRMQELPINHFQKATSSYRSFLQKEGVDRHDTARYSDKKVSESDSLPPLVSELDGLNCAEKTAYCSFQSESSINTIEVGLRLFWRHRGRVIAHTSKTQHESSTVNEEAHT